MAYLTSGNTLTDRLGLLGHTRTPKKIQEGRREECPRERGKVTATHLPQAPKAGANRYSTSDLSRAADAPLSP